MKLNSIQKKLLQTHNNNYRFIYNKAIGLLSDNFNYEFPIKTDLEYKKINGTVSYNKFELRNLLVPEEVNSRTPWVLKTGFSIRSKAVFEAHKNWKTNVNLVKSGNKKFFNLTFKKKKDIKWTFDIEHANITTNVDAFGKTEFSLYETSGFIKTTEFFEIKNDCSIHFDGKYYYILVPHEKCIKESKAEHLFTALDPGIRKFQVAYSPDDKIHIIGKNSATKIHQLVIMIDRAISRNDKRLELHLRRKISNLQKELHDKTSRFLCENYRNIYIPKLTKNNDIIKSKSRKIKNKTVRQMVLLAHCKFVEKLKTKASEYNNINVREITEEYTSQTCLKCHKKTKTSNEIYNCKNCRFKIDRDILGSRNILLKSWNLM